MPRLRPQAMRDMQNSVTLAQDIASQSVAEERAAWRARALPFWKDQQAPTVAKTAPALCRKQAYEWLAGLDRMIEILTGAGLSQFVLTDADRARLPAHELPCLVVAADQGPGGFAVLNWLMYEKKAQVLSVYDTSHRTWNDIQLALDACGLW